MSALPLPPPIEEIVQFLREPSVYGDDSNRIEMIETHLSHVFLSRTRAIKLKKPVRFEFVNFSTAAARRLACEDEVKLNQHWADSVYHGVAPITVEIGGHLALEGKGAPVEWVVAMRRLNEADSLESRLKQGSVNEGLAGALAEHLVAKYEQVPTADISPFGYAGRVRAHQRANTQNLLQYASPAERGRICRIHSALAGFLWTRREVFEERVERGCIIEGHGDLRPEHIYLESPPRVIDGIEFSRDLRTIDILDELCFLEMECERHQGHGVSRALHECYCRRFNDTPPPQLVQFYKAYRATVRAKVDALHLAQEPRVVDKLLARDLRSHLARADFHADKLGRPWIIVVCGLMGSGKSTLASTIAEEAGAKLLQTDEVRRTLLGPSDSPAEYRCGNYSLHLREQVYHALLEEVGASLDRGVSVVADGTFLTRKLRLAVAEIARRRLAALLFVSCHAPQSVVMDRIQKRFSRDDSTSEARPDLYDRQAEVAESFDSGLPRIDVETTTSVRELVEEARCALAVSKR